MELNGFMIGPEIKTLFKIKVGAVFTEHPVVVYNNFDKFRVPTLSNCSPLSMKL